MLTFLYVMTSTPVCIQHTRPVRIGSPSAISRSQIPEALTPVFPHYKYLYNVCIFIDDGVLSRDELKMAPFCFATDYKIGTKEEDGNNTPSRDGDDEQDDDEEEEEDGGDDDNGTIGDGDSHDDKNDNVNGKSTH